MDGVERGGGQEGLWLKPSSDLRRFLIRYVLVIVVMQMQRAGVSIIPHVEHRVLNFFVFSRAKKALLFALAFCLSPFRESFPCQNENISSRFQVRRKRGRGGKFSHKIKLLYI